MDEEKEKRMIAESLMHIFDVLPKTIEYRIDLLRLVGFGTDMKRCIEIVERAIQYEKLLIASSKPVVRQPEFQLFIDKLLDNMARWKTYGGSK